MKKILKSKIFWGLIVTFIVVGFLGYSFFNKPKQVEYVTQPAEITDVIQTVAATGKLKSASEIELNFKNSGRLAVLNVKVGDQVKAGQILAQLRSTDLVISVNQARADLAESIANLDKLKAGATSEDIAVYEAAVNQAKTDLENTKKTYSQALSNERQNILVDINTVLTKANISLQKIYDILNHKGDSNNFQTSNISLYRQVQINYQDSMLKVDDAELAYNLANLNINDENIDVAAEKTQLAILEVSSTLKNLANLLDYAIINLSFTRNDLDTAKSSVNTERVAIDSSINTIQTANQDLVNARINYDTKVEQGQNTLTRAQADLALKKASARPEDVALYEARVQRARAALSLAQDKYDETVIRAPIDGVITEVNFSIGEQTSLSQPVVTMLASDNYEIEVDIPESDIIKIGVGDDVEITLDAFSSEEIFAGVITTVNPAQTEIQDVVYYRVTVTFKDEQPQNVQSLVDSIKPGMTANVNIKTAEANSVLAIPLRAVKDKDGKKIVEVLEADNQIREAEVILGLKGDEGLVEVSSGLSEGEKVITYTREAK